MAKQDRWEFPIYWYIEELDRRPGGFIATMTYHWSKPANRSYVVKTRQGNPSISIISNLLWSLQWSNEALGREDA